MLLDPISRFGFLYETIGGCFSDGGLPVPSCSLNLRDPLRAPARDKSEHARKASNGLDVKKCRRRRVITHRALPYVHTYAGSTTPVYRITNEFDLALVNVEQEQARAER